MSWARIGVVVLLLVVYLGSAFSPALMDDADATHAEAAREMLVRDDYVTLHINGVRYLEKAPLPYWAVALAFRLFGVTEFAARLPNLLAVLLTALLAMRWGRRAFGERAGVYAGLFVASTVGIYLFTRILIPEAILSLLIAASLYFWLCGLSDSHWWQWYLGYACLALAVLTKGLVALVFVGGSAFIYLAITGEWRRWRDFRLGSGLLLFFVIAAPWHLLAGFRNRGFFWFYFVNEHFLRFLGKRYPKDYNKPPVRALLEPASGLALSLEHVSAGLSARTALEAHFSRSSQFPPTAGATGEGSPADLCRPLAPALLPLGRPDTRVFRDFNEPGILHVSGIFPDAAALGWSAGGQRIRLERTSDPIQRAGGPAIRWADWVSGDSR